MGLPYRELLKSDGLHCIFFPFENYTGYGETQNLPDLASRNWIVSGQNSDRRHFIAGTFVRELGPGVLVAHPENGSDREALEKLCDQRQLSFEAIKSKISSLDLSCATLLLDGDSLWICRDKIGFQPLYYRRLDSSFAFSTDLKSLSELEKDKGLELDKQSAVNYLMFGRPRLGETNFSEVSSIPASHSLSFECGSWTRPTPRRYWQPSDHKLPLKSFDGRLKILSETLEQAVLATFQKSRNAILLSGGLDSSYICYVAAKHNVRDVNCYTVTYKNSIYPDEFRFAEVVSDHFELPLFQVELSVKDLLRSMKRVLSYPIPISAWSTILSDCLVDRIGSNGIQNVISGFGSDELFASSQKIIEYYFALRARIADQGSGVQDILQTDLDVGDVLFPGVADFFELSDLTSYVHPSIDLNFIYRDLIHFYADQGPINDETNIFSRFVSHECAHRIPDLILANFRLGAQQQNVSLRYPFLQSDFVSYATSLYPKERIYFKDNKWTFKYAMHLIARDVLPHRILYRPRGLFDLPFARLLREEEVFEYVQSVLTGSSLWSTNILSERVLDKLLMQLNDNRTSAITSDRYWSNKLWAVLSLCSWSDGMIARSRKC